MSLTVWLKICRDLLLHQRRCHSAPDPVYASYPDHDCYHAGSSCGDSPLWTDVTGLQVALLLLLRRRRPMNRLSRPSAGRKHWQIALVDYSQNRFHQTPGQNGSASLAAEGNGRERSSSQSPRHLRRLLRHHPHCHLASSSAAIKQPTAY